MFRKIQAQVKQHPLWAVLIGVVALVSSWGAFWGGIESITNQAAVLEDAVTADGSPNRPPSTQNAEVTTASWGPKRETFTATSPAPYVTFNSITNSPSYGDHRDFVLAKNGAIRTAGEFQNSIEIVDGGSYLVRVLISNEAELESDTALDTRVAGTVPTTVSKSHVVQVSVSASNSRPKEVWDGVRFTSDKEFSIGYVSGSARFLTNSNPNDGYAVPDSLISEDGALVGSSQTDGVVPGGPGYKSSGVLVFRVRSYTVKQSPEFEINQQLRAYNAKAKSHWQNEVTAKPGQSVEFQIQFRNTGERQLDNVVLMSDLPQELEYVPGSSKLTNSSTPDGAPISDGVIGKRGVNIGSYMPTANAYVSFRAMVSKSVACGSESVGATSRGITDYGTKQVASVVAIKRSGPDC